MTKGETLKLCVVDPCAVSVEFRFGGASVQTAAGVKDGTSFEASVSTTAWAVGNYRWQAWAIYEDDSTAITSEGSFELVDVLGVGDVRSQAEKMVDMIEAMIAGNASEGVRRYKINNRELERYSVEELLKLLSYWKQQLKRERHCGGGLGPRIVVRF